MENGSSRGFAVVIVEHSAQFVATADAAHLEEARRRLDQFVERSRCAAGELEGLASHVIGLWHCFRLFLLDTVDRGPAYAPVPRSTLTINTAPMHIKKVPPTPS